MNEKLPGLIVELTSLETTSTKKGGNKISETLRSKLSEGLQKILQQRPGGDSDVPNNR